MRAVKTQANKLTEIKALLQQGLEENMALRAELNRLKDGTRERVEVVRAPEEPISAELNGSKSWSPLLKRRARVTARARREACEAIPVCGGQESFLTKSRLESAITGCRERLLNLMQSRASLLDAWAHYIRVKGNITQPEIGAMTNKDGADP